MSNADSKIPHPSSAAFRPSILLFLNALAMMVVAVWFRCRSLGNIPGVNGDEAWYGVQAWQMLHGGIEGGWHTPTGNPLSPLFVGPLALLHLWLPPSIVVLRSVAVLGGLAALAVNWLCCRWVFDRRTAMISTVALAILPVNIVDSRFAWDASQSLAASLPVVYLALAAVRFPDRFGRLIAISVLALAIAIWVHPTNIFAGAAIAVAFAARGLAARKNIRCQKSSLAARLWCAGVLLAAALLMAAWIWTAQPGRGPLPELLSHGADNVRDLPSAAGLLPRLFVGGTVYRYIAGSRSWFEWPLPAGSDGWGLDVAVFWAIVFGAVWMLWRSWRSDGEDRRPLCLADRALLAAWALEIAAFLLVAGPRAMTPGQERFALCLIGPTVLLAARGAALAWETAAMRGRLILAMAVLLGWAMLADFHAHYFRFIEQTGGQAHLTFRTGGLEPKQAALWYIVNSAGSSKVAGSEAAPNWIICSQWWNYWPIRYLAVADRGLRVLRPKEIGSPEDYGRALNEGRVWFVEFCDTDAQREAESHLAGRRLARQEFFDYAGRPIVCVLHAMAEQR